MLRLSLCRSPEQPRQELSKWSAGNQQEGHRKQRKERAQEHIEQRSNDYRRHQPRTNFKDTHRVGEALEEGGLQLRQEGLERGAGLAQQRLQRAQDGRFDARRKAVADDANQRPRDL